MLSFRAEHRCTTVQQLCRAGLKLSAGSPAYLATTVSRRPTCVTSKGQIRTYARSGRFPQVPRAASDASQAPSLSRNTSSSSAGAQIGVLFVCLGNICRSPTAEAVFRAAVERRGLAHRFDIDSCGTGGGNPDWYLGGGSYHEGDESDSRMAAAAKRRGVTLTSRSRSMTPQDFTRFQYVVAMDGANVRAIHTASEYWRSRPSATPQMAVPEDYRSRVTLMTDYCSTAYLGRTSVPDPYYGGPQGFELVLDLLDDACTGLLEQLCVKHEL